MTITERVAIVREAAPEPTKNNRILVIPNDAPAYRMQGKFGLYDTKTCHWINFRNTELEAYQLLATILQDPDRA